ncbi:hypothetical protein UA14_05309 [Burkholderia multivorans]|nr:hypothetical protein UA14_05309 [Burkholderia multivorans]
MLEFGKFARKAMLAGIGAALLASGAHASETSCDRGCLKSSADRLLDSMVKHAPDMVPLSDGYMATENGRPAALPMMTLWRTVTGIKERYYVVDPKSGQLFVVATAAEGARDTLLFGRIKVAPEGKLSEIELYEDRSRGDGGFHFGLQDGPMAFPGTTWTVPVKPAQRASRDALLLAGRSIFDPRIPGPPIAAGCMMMENGKFSDENPEVLKQLMPSDADFSSVQLNAKGMAQVPCASPPERPVDKHARTDIADEESGVVVSMAMISGLVQPYLVTHPTDSAFVPADLMQPYVDLLGKQRASGKYTAPAMRAMPVTSVVAQMYRVYDGKMQGMSLLFNLQPHGAQSPWVQTR